MPRDLYLDRGGNIYVTGSADFATPTGWDVYTVKYSSERIRQWTMRYNGPGSTNEHGLGLSTNVNDAIYVAVATYSSGTELGVLGLTPNGAIINSISRSVAPDSTELHGSVFAQPQQGFVLVGSVLNDSQAWNFLAAGYDHIWEKAWEAQYDGPGDDDLVTGVARDQHDNFVLTGRSHFSTGSWDAATWKEAMSGPGIASSPRAVPRPGIRVSPNPARGGFDVELASPGTVTIRDALGRTTRQVRSSSRTLSVSGLSAGVYFVEGPASRAAHM